MRVETEYRCGCVYSNNRWFPECPRHFVGWSAQSGTSENYIQNKKYKKNNALIVYGNTSLSMIKSKVDLVLTYPMFDGVLESVSHKKNQDYVDLYNMLTSNGTLVIMSNIETQTKTLYELHLVGFFCVNVITVIESDLSSKNVLLVFKKVDKRIKQLPTTMYFPDIASPEAYLIRTLCPENGLVFDPYCVCVHIVDGAMHEQRRFIGFCQGHKLFDKIKFYMENFKRDDNAFNYPTRQS